MRTTGKTRTYRGEVLSLESPELLEFARYELSRNRHLQIRVSGSSMRPTLDDGDLVTIVPTDARSLNPQDIVLVGTSSRTALIHRILSVRHREGMAYVLTRGDHSQYVDSPVPLTQILGRVISLQRRGRGKAIALPRRVTLLTRARFWFNRLLGK